MEERDLPRFVEWLADRDVTRWLAAMGEPPTLEDEREWYERRREDPESVMWSIETLDRQLAGTVELRLTPRAKRAEMGIAIQDKARWSQGLGTDTVRLVLRYAFEDLQLNRVELTTDEENTRAVRGYEKCGFVLDGLFGLTEERFPNLVWLIETLDGRPVGHLGLLQVDPHHKRAELAISIGEKDCWSRGYGTDAIRTVLRHGFEDLGLRRVDLHTDADNARGIRCYEKCGFVREGLMRESRLRYGKPLDMVLMAVLRDEWQVDSEQ